MAHGNQDLGRELTFEYSNSGDLYFARKKLFGNNLIRSTKYNAVTFLPLALLEQFHQVGNMYFLFVSILMILGEYTTIYDSPYVPWSTVIILTIILTISITRSGMEDLRRRKTDDTVNSLRVGVYRPGYSVENFDYTVRWKDIVVGDLVIVRKDEQVPADLVILSTSDTLEQIAFVETSNIDGESNLKQKKSVSTLLMATAKKRISKPNDDMNIESPFKESEESQKKNFITDQFYISGDSWNPPKSLLDFQSGSLSWEEAQLTNFQPSDVGDVDHSSLERAKQKLSNNENSMHGANSKGAVGDHLVVGLDPSMLLLRGSSLRNTHWAIGIVVYTGLQTKIVMNNRNAPFKRSTIDKIMDKLIILVLLGQIIISLVSAGLYWRWTMWKQNDLPYLCYQPERRPEDLIHNMFCNMQTRYSRYGYVCSFFILYCEAIPISLYVTVELCNFILAYFIEHDSLLYDPLSNTRAAARTSNMNSDLGMVEYIFSDKTGTLTENVMRFCRCSIGGRIFGNAPSAAVDKSEQFSTTSMADSKLVNLEDYSRGLPLEFLSQPHKISQDSNTEIISSVEEFSLALALCHNVIVDELDPNTLLSESPDEDALVSAAGKYGCWKFVGRNPGRVRLLHCIGSSKLDESSTKSTSSSNGNNNDKVFEEVEYELLATIPFNSVRKRMSVLVRDPDGKITIYTKGADNIILGLAKRYARLASDFVSLKQESKFSRSSKHNMKEEQHIKDTGDTEEQKENNVDMMSPKDVIMQHLDLFSSGGLRVLLVAKRDLTSEEFIQFSKLWEAAEISLTNRNQLQEQAAALVERDLFVLGVTAIEDKLQVGVPETLRDLGNAGIKVWVLTGDKMETAINIGYSSGLLVQDMVLIRLHADQLESNSHVGIAAERLDIRRKLQRILAQFTRLAKNSGERFKRWLDLRRRYSSASNRRLMAIKIKQKREKVQRQMATHSGCNVASSDERTPTEAENVEDGEVNVKDIEEFSRLLEYELRGIDSGRNTARDEMQSTETGETMDEEQLSVHIDRLLDTIPEGDFDTPNPINSSNNANNCSDAGSTTSDEGTPLLFRSISPKNIPSISQLTSNHVALIVDGDTLLKILGDPVTEQLFLSVSTICKSVIACRVSPEQKRLLVQLVKLGVKPRPITLAIGDGANDVAMIQEAQLGVGISGKEGNFAVNNADFGIAQFRFLKRLLIIHGRLNYRRMSKALLFSFYKNMVHAVVLFLYSFYSLMSGISLIETYIGGSSNLLLVPPIIAMGVFDRDISETTLSKYSFLYVSGRKQLDLNVNNSLWELWHAIFDGCIIFFLPLIALSQAGSVWNGSDGMASGIVQFGTAVYFYFVISMFMRLGMLTNTWTYFVHIIFWICILGLFIFLIIFQYLYLLTWETYGIANELFSMPMFWLLLFAIPVIIGMADLTITLVKRELHPSIVDIGMEHDAKQRKQRHRRKRMQIRQQSARNHDNSNGNINQNESDLETATRNTSHNDLHDEDDDNSFLGWLVADDVDVHGDLDQLVTQIFALGPEGKFPLDWTAVQSMFSSMKPKEQESLGMHHPPSTASFSSPPENGDIRSNCNTVDSNYAAGTDDILVSKDASTRNI